MSLKIVTWLWNSGKPHWKKRIQYLPKHVMILANMFKRHLKMDHEVVCITDQPKSKFRKDIRVIPIWNDYADLGGCFRRLRLFSKEIGDLVGKRFVSIDLDVVLVGDVTSIFNRDEEFIIWGEHFRKTPYCGSLVLMNAGCREEVWRDFDPADHPPNHRKMYPYGTDQDRITLCLYPNEAMWTSTDGVHNFNYTIRKWDRFARTISVVSASKYHTQAYGIKLNKKLSRDSKKLPREFIIPFMAGNGELPKGCKMVLFNGMYAPWDPHVIKNYAWVKEHWK